jgi:NADH dehydrogenase/NADH:ubiquinone oxidoreductase subunit G
MTIKLFLDGQEIKTDESATLLEAARTAGIDIPTICWYPATTSNGLCRLCVVEVEGMRLLQPGCIARAAEGMKVQTKSERVIRARRTILEMLASSVDLSDSPEILALMQEYGASAERFPEAKRRDIPLKDDNPMYARDYAKCVLCWRCVQVCAEDAQYTYAINFSGRGYETEIGTYFDTPMPATTCVFCGQCVGVCPTGALKPRREFLLEQGVAPDQIAAMNTGRKSKVKGQKSG